MKNSMFLGILLLVAVLLVAGCTASNPPANSEGQNPASVPSQPASFSISNQDFSGGSVALASVFLDKPGFAVVHRINEDGSAGAIAGYSSLISGSQSNVLVSLSQGQTDGQLLAMFHYDDGDGVFDEEKDTVHATANGFQVDQLFSNTYVEREQPTGGLQIMVKDPQGNRMENAVVEIFLEEGVEPDSFQFLERQTTNASGAAEFTFVPLGEIYVTAGDAGHAFQAASAEVNVVAGETVSLTLNLAALLPEPELPAPQAVEFSLESDDSGFYQNGAKVSTIDVLGPSTINLTVIVRNTNVAFGGLDFKSSAFPTFNVPKGQTKTVSFSAPPLLIKIESFWPSSSIKKSEVNLNVK